MNIQLSEHFTYRKLLRFTLPSMVMMVFTSIYGVVDGVFISNFVGSDPFAAINLIMPFLMILGALGFMLGSGGSALVGFYLGMGQEKRANEIFSLLIYVLLGVGAALTVLGLLFLEPVARLLGADADLLPYCVRYGRIVLLGLIPFTLQNVFQSFLVTAERPHFGLYASHLLPPPQHQPPAAHPDPLGASPGAEERRQRLLGVHDQYLHVHRHHAL